MKEYTLDGEKYYFNGKRWIDSDGLVVPSFVAGRLNLFLINDDAMFSASDNELLQYAANIKEGENYSLAIRAMEILLDRGNADIVKSVLPRLTSCYRKVGRVEDAIGLAEGYIANRTAHVETDALFTSLGAAYCDIGEYDKAKDYANRAYAMNGGIVSSVELSNLYERIDKCEERTSSSSKRKSVERENVLDVKELKKVEFSDSLEREAMNHIWKAIPAEDRAKYYDDFEIVCNGLKKGKLTSLKDNR